MGKACYRSTIAWYHTKRVGIWVDWHGEAGRKNAPLADFALSGTSYTRVGAGAMVSVQYHEGVQKKYYFA